MLQTVNFIELIFLHCLSFTGIFTLLGIQHVKVVLVFFVRFIFDDFLYEIQFNTKYTQSFESKPTSVPVSLQRYTVFITTLSSSLHY